jgi:hypothetical protein
VISGQGWLSVEDLPDPLQLKAGDCFVLPSGRPFRLATDLTATPVDFRNFFYCEVYSHAYARRSEDCFIAGGHFAFTRSHASILLGVLPPIVHIQRESDRAALRWCIEPMTQEIHEPQPGGSLIAEHVAYMMLIQGLRLHLAETTSNESSSCRRLANSESELFCVMRADLLNVAASTPAAVGHDR